MVEAIGKLINTTASCSPPFVQRAAQAALEHDAATRDDYMARFRRKVERLCDGPGDDRGLPRRPARRARSTSSPTSAPICNRLGITSHGLALYLLEGADDAFGVACLGGECFGEAGRGFLRFSCAEPDERIDQAVAFLPDALARTDRVRIYPRGESPVRAPRALPQGDETNDDRPSVTAVFPIARGSSSTFWFTPPSSAS